MGLDMYLKATKYVGGWTHRREPLFDSLRNLMGITPDEGAPSFTVSANIGYWRKANAIHAWFVQNVQKGEDDCGDYGVSREELQALRDACKQVLDSVETVEGRVSEGKTLHSDGRVEHHSRAGAVVTNSGMAAKVLPTKSGFFFGKTEYDEDYLTDLRETVAIVDRCLSPELNDWDFEYHASW